VLEQKYDSLFEIVNNVVKELTSIKKVVLQNNIQQTGNGFVIPTSLESSQSNNISNVFNQYQKEDEDNTDDDYDEEEEEEEDEDEENEDDEETDNEEDNASSEEEEEDDASEEDDDYSDVEESNEDEPIEEVNTSEDVNIDEYEHVENISEIQLEETIIKSDTTVKYTSVPIESSPSTIEDLTSSIKVISVDLNETNTLSHQEIQLANETVDDTEDNSIIHVNKLDIIMENTENISLPKKEEYDYRKLTITQLKTLVISRGLATDTNKLKKNDLIKLLETNE
jgi:hypothetical protein